MASKKITELQLISAVTDTLDFAADDGLQTYRTTASQIYAYLKSKGWQKTIQTKTANYTALISDALIRCNSSSAFNITLPSSSVPTGYVLTIKNINTGKITIVGTIDGFTNRFLYYRWDEMTVVYNGTNWDILNFVEAPVYSKYFDNSGQSLGASTVFKYDTVQFQSGTEYDATTGTFTASSPGVYMFNAIAASSTAIQNGQWALKAIKNTTDLALMAIIGGPQSTNTFNTIQVNGLIQLALADTIQIVSESSPGLTTSNGVSFLSICKVK